MADVVGVQRERGMVSACVWPFDAEAEVPQLRRLELSTVNNWIHAVFDGFITGVARESMFFLLCRKNVSS
jgi:hypothetical protein